MNVYEVINKTTGKKLVFVGLDAKHRFSIEHWIMDESKTKYKLSPRNLPMTKEEKEDFLYMIDNNLNEISTSTKIFKIRDINNKSINNISNDEKQMPTVYEMINEFDGKKKIVESIENLPRYQKEIFEELKSSGKLESTQFGIIYKIVKPLNEAISRLQKIAGIDVDLGGYDDTKLPSQEPSDPEKNGIFPKVDKLEFKRGLANQVKPQDYEFHNDQFAFDKFAQGINTAQSEKCDTPADVISCIDQRIKELNGSLNDYEGVGYSNQSSMKTNAIEFLEKVKSLMDHKDLEGIKLTQIEYGRLANKVTDLLPPKVVNYILTAINPLASENRDNVDASERDRTNIP